MSAVPAITLTNPQNQDSAPTPAQSPIKVPPEEQRGIASASGRPVTPTSSSDRPTSSNSNWTSPNKSAYSPSTNGSGANGYAAASPTRRDGGGANGHEVRAAIDPLSQQILRRTNAPLNLPAASRPGTSDSKARKNDRSREHSPAPAVQEPSRTDLQDASHKDLKKGVKAVSFMSRLMRSSKKKEAEDIVVEDEVASNDGRPEGNHVRVFSQPVDNMSFSPRHPQPPAYIKIRSKHKRERDFDRLFLAQELDCNVAPRLARQNSGGNKLRRKSSATPDANPIWAMEFSKDGKHMATAGADTIVRVWAVLGSSDDRQKHEKQESKESEANGVDAHSQHLSAPVFQSRPVREYVGHTASVLDLSWSKNNFLLSSSMDKTVRLWHVSRSECLCTFKHHDFVPSIAFHPKDDRFFLAGSLDSRLRLWSIPDKSVAYSAQVPDMITAVTFTPDGKYAMAGCLSGLCMFYETEGMKYQTQIHVRSSRGQNAKGSKITGLQAHHSPGGDVKILITSNDSRIRLYNFRDKSLELKFKGNENNSSQIRASLSDCGRYVVCGSEDRKAYIWSLGPAEGEKRDKRPMEMFEAHDTITTIVCMAPTKSRHHLSKSEDPVYDLCNPPPVTLMSRAERAESQSSSKPPTESGSVQGTPAELEAKPVAKLRESAAYVGRSAHKDGNIIVTADYTGRIKVFRQDCAWTKRGKLDDGDRASLFSRRNGRGSRNGSIATKASQRSLRDGRTSTSTQAPSERILSWRQGIASTPSVVGTSASSGARHTTRSMSPRKSLDGRARPAEDRTAADGNNNTSKSQAPLSATSTTQAEPDPSGEGHKSPTDKEDNPLKIMDGQSYAHWDMNEWKARAEKMRKMHELHPLTPVESVIGGGSGGGSDTEHLRPGGGARRGESFVSKLSDERSSSPGGEDDEFDDAQEDQHHHQHQHQHQHHDENDGGTRR